MAKAFKLDVEPDLSFKLVALVTAEPIFRIAWHLNEIAGFKFSETEPMMLYHPKRLIMQEFQCYTSMSETHEDAELIQNKGESGLLMEDQKQVDYFIKINVEDYDVKDLITQLKPIKNISLAFEIIPGSLKSPQRLIYQRNA